MEARGVRLWREDKVMLVQLRLGREAEKIRLYCLPQ